ncbi:hypothetical protein AS189_15550 [Arthrobacter alpinus]|uniref:6-phosphogluconolactonase, cycloisomerase 2 family n=1 Tax=Arthrobacter alpinus TaxID=656366 RepID=A0A0S2M1I6_9MICC|nr:beta-propeller fold lactonase family protein [Arthrobacter alpinus]ALO67637.1 hypothetical protein AS189_15550 [Arthrobacter alpinus]
MPTTPELIVSGYTQEGYGAGPGMVRYALLADGTVGEQLAQGAAVSNPSFMADGGAVLFAVEELEHGNVVAVDPWSLEVLGRVSSGGADSCHVALVDSAVWVANYSSGTAAVLPAEDVVGLGINSGSHGAPVQPIVLAHPGSGPVSDRQGESHAHQVTATEWGTVLVADLGSDRVDEYSAESHVRLGSAELPPGTGPRHVAIKGEFLLVAGELDGYLHVMRRTVRDAHGEYFWHWLFKVPLAENSHAVADADQFFPSHIQLSDDGSKLYAAVRGPDTVVVLDVTGLNVPENTDAAPTSPRFLQQLSSGGTWPRHFAVANNKMYVANQNSNTVAVFNVDSQGLLGQAPLQSVKFGSPTCVLPR